MNYIYLFIKVTAKAGSFSEVAVIDPPSLKKYDNWNLNSYKNKILSRERFRRLMYNYNV